MLIAPSWGGMVNGLLTLRGAWDRVREDPVLKFMVVGVTAYGMATFEGPMLSLKSVNALTHYTDYIIGHVHLGALGWNGGLDVRDALLHRPAHLRHEALLGASSPTAHFWLAHARHPVLRRFRMYVGGITQSLMWQRVHAATASLRYPNFLETVVRIVPMYALRAVGGTLFIDRRADGGLQPLPHGARRARSCRTRARRGAAAGAAAAGRSAGPWHRALEARAAAHSPC